MRERPPSRPAHRVTRSPSLRTIRAGYQSLDLQITKNFELGDMGSMYIRIDALNVTNEENLVDYIDTSGPDGIITSTRYAPFGNITGVPRTVRMSLGVKF